MFRKDLEFFRSEENCKRFMGQNPPDHHRSPPPPHFGGPPPLGHVPPFPGIHPRAPIPMGKDSFQEIRDYMLLLIISEHSEGTTGYQLQEKYHFPRGTLLRTLQDLEEKGYLQTKEEIIDGRPNKFYLITNEGKKFLEELKLKWATIFGRLAEINPESGMKYMLESKIEEFETIEDADDFFRGFRFWSKGMLKNIENRVKKFKIATARIDEIIKEIGNMETLNKKKLRELVRETARRIGEENLNKK
ncbi:MAG: helix-turn-helix transcriptional regulator [Promethearchaeota archaeon]